MESTPKPQPAPGPRPTASPQPTTEPPARPSDAVKRPASRPPRPGTTIQRSDRENRRKAILLATPLPPPRPRRRSCVAAATRGRPSSRPFAGTNSGAPSTPVGVTKPGQVPPGQPPAAAAVSTGPPTASRVPPPAGLSRPPAGSRQSPSAEPAGRPSPSGPDSRQSRSQMVDVELGDGTHIQVPLITALLGRKFRTRTATGRWIVRFDHRGRPRCVRRLNEASSV